MLLMPMRSLSFCLVHISFVPIVHLLCVRVCAYVLFVGLGVQRHLLNYEQSQLLVILCTSI